MEPPVPPDPLISARDGGDAVPGAAARRQARAGLYVHVPFCTRRCPYCDFSSEPLTAAGVQRYLAALEREAALRSPAAAGTRFSSVFFGGGTPSALPPAQFRRAWEVLASHFAIAPGAEITLEANPESARPSRLEAWAACGVNRLSLGAQSFDAAELERLGRVHAAGRTATIVRLARSFGFGRLSLDLIFGFPGQTRASWRRSLDRALDLDPGHLSAYCFIAEPGTPLGDSALRGEAVLPADSEQAEMYADLSARADAAGYRCYETSNFSRRGEEARHNLVYWLRRSYLGLGPSAHGFVAGERYGNHRTLARWADAVARGELPEAMRESESPASAAREVLMLGLRLGSGARPEDHEQSLWRQLVERYGPAWERGVATGRLQRAADGVSIPAALRFVADDVIAWVEAEADRAPFDRLSAGYIPSHPCHRWRFPAA